MRLRRKGDKYILRACFFDSEKINEYVEPVWDTEEYQETIKGFYVELEQICLENKIYKWDGFKRSDPFVKDGHIFEIQIDLEDGKSIEARGSNSYPKNFHDAHEGFEDLMNEIAKVY